MNSNFVSPTTEMHSSKMTQVIDKWKSTYEMDYDVPALDLMNQETFSNACATLSDDDQISSDATLSDWGGLRTEELEIRHLRSENKWLRRENCSLRASKRRAARERKRVPQEPAFVSLKNDYMYANPLPCFSDHSTSFAADYNADTQTIDKKMPEITLHSAQQYGPLETGIASFDDEDLAYLPSPFSVVQVPSSPMTARDLKGLASSQEQLEEPVLDSFEAQEVDTKLKSDPTPGLDAFHDDLFDHDSWWQAQTQNLHPQNATSMQTKLEEQATTQDEKMVQPTPTDDGIFKAERDFVAESIKSQEASTYSSPTTQQQIKLEDDFVGNSFDWRQLGQSIDSKLFDTKNFLNALDEHDIPTATSQAQLRLNSSREFAPLSGQPLYRPDTMVPLRRAGRMEKSNITIPQVKIKQEIIPDGEAWSFGDLLDTDIGRESG